MITWAGEAANNSGISPGARRVSRPAPDLSRVDTPAVGFLTPLSSRGAPNHLDVGNPTASACRPGVSRLERFGRPKRRQISRDVGTPTATACCPRRVALRTLRPPGGSAPRGLATFTFAVKSTALSPSQPSRCPEADRVERLAAFTFAWKPSALSNVHVCLEAERLENEAANSPGMSRETRDSTRSAARRRSSSRPAPDLSRVDTPSIGFPTPPSSERRRTNADVGNPTASACRPGVSRFERSGRPKTRHHKLLATFTLTRSVGTTSTSRPTFPRAEHLERLAAFTFPRNPNTLNPAQPSRLPGSRTP